MTTPRTYARQRYKKSADGETMTSQPSKNVPRLQPHAAACSRVRCAKAMVLPPQLRITAVGLACFALAATAIAAPLLLVQSPPGSGRNEPAPNVIISVDDSGSMGKDVDDNSPDSTHPSKIQLLKNALTAQFGDANATPPTTGKLPDNRIRLAWQAMHNNGNSSGAGSLSPGLTNSMKSFSGAHRTNFSSFVNSLTDNGDTPSHQMMENAYNYMRSPAGVSSPWADAPGTAQSTPYLGCRRTYHIFMTDGAWNANPAMTAGNADGIARTLGNGTTNYVPTSDQVKAYQDCYGAPGGSTCSGSSGSSNNPSTLSDLAFRNWATDLQDGTGGTQNMPNSITARIRRAGNETVTNTATNPSHSTTLQEFWNPKNNPATWQHITQYTIGFGAAATTWTGAPFWDTTKTGTSWNDDSYGGDYAQLVNGDVAWPDVIANSSTRTAELWHMALNGRGKFYPARTQDTLTAAFGDILDTIILDTSKPLMSIATSSSYLRSGLSAYIAGYSADKWSGLLAARPIDAANGSLGTTETWNAATLLDASNFSVANRFVLSYSGTAGVPWTTWASLPSLQQTPLNSNAGGIVDSLGQSRVDFIRGDRSKEAAQTSGVFRDRTSRLGDIVNSNIWYTGKPASGYTMNGYSTFRSRGDGGKGGRTPMVYIGANDGMLHGFAASNWPSTASATIPGGTELLAYIPQGVAQGNLRKLTDSSYSHQYFVDGTPFSGDAYIGSTPAWATVLVGTLGAGGKGYFVLDVTDPAQFTASNAANLVITDTTAIADADIGNITSPPVVDDAGKSRQVVKMNWNDATGQNVGRWATVLGNGYNSTNEAPVLLVQYLDGDKAIKKISPCTLPTILPTATGACSFQGGGNGLSSPQLIDLNGDGTVDVAYAGDLKGNLWKFNLTSATDSNWQAAFAKQPFFVAKASNTASTRPNASVTQPITTAPYWMQHPLGGIMLAVGTGQNLTLPDQTSSGTDSYYALYDNSTFTTSSASKIVSIADSTPINTTSSTLLPTTLVQQTITDTLAEAGATYYTSSSNAVNYGGGTPKRGWYLDWSYGGQRVLHNTRAFSGQKILVQSTVPKAGTSSSTESCTSISTTERSFLSILNMFTGNPSVLPPFTLTATTTSNQNVTTIETSPGGDNKLIRTDDKIKLLKANCPAGQSCTALDLNPDKYAGKRVNWREIQ
jgi:type IV pilus assembly protein PilY1